MNKILKQDINNRGIAIYDYYQEFIKMYCPQKWYKSQLEFIINDKKEINGKAWCDGNKDYVELNSGVIDLYYDYFTKIMENSKIIFFKQLFPEIEEDKLKEMSYEGIVFKDEKANIFDNKIVDDEKAKLLEIFVSRFIITHEIGHVLSGHCKLIADISKDKTNFIPMYYYEKESSITPEEALDIRTMEMDADAFAVTQSMYFITYLYNNFEKKVKIQLMEPEDIFYWWAFAIRSQFLVCQDHFADNNYYKKMTHLPSNARWAMIYLTALEVLESFNISGQEKENFKNKITKGSIDAEIKFNEIKYTQYNLINEIDNNKEYKDYRDEINHNWDILKIKLLKYSRVILFEEK